ncbi:hypothetical protein [Aureispira sp. CCB-E]|uniref:hypothetical protein n=1 Tax=Aureispira sp. CCB-E TaxID=3051121 RepID=UPI00286962D0|nr:hypothetical protein [Aureispira sp. CCB-E]WMX16842.1 hypothetical protein QP953_10715 [Aureispira sp. CCB-E]
MNRLISLLFILLSFWQTSYSQTTICEKNTTLYFSCYKLLPNQRFSYQYIDGSGETIGVGTYTVNKKELVFEYDSLASPIITKSQTALAPNTIQITCSYILDSFPRLFHPVVYNKKLFFCDSLGQVRVPNYTEGTILIHNYTDSILINPKIDDANNYHIYTHSAGDKFIAKGTVQILEKKGKLYRRRIQMYFDKKGLPNPEKEVWKYIYFNVYE